MAAGGSGRILTIPNLISALRIAVVPLFWWVLLGERDIGMAAALILVIGSTDWVDGYLARRLNQVSDLGKALDPIADRLMVGSAVVGGLIAGVVPAVIALLLIGRELVMAVAALYTVSRGGGIVEVAVHGKVATFLLYVAIPSFYLAAAGVLPWLFTPPAWIAGSIGTALYWYVVVGYVGEMRKRLAR